MFKSIRFAALLFGALILFGGAVCINAQGADEDPMFPGRKKEDPPRGIQESLVKMRIDKDKKDYSEMLKRGDDAAKLAAALKDGSIAGQQDQISNIGKLVKKIRDELGAEGSDGEPDSAPGNQTDAIRALKEQVTDLSEDLKKSNRFTISASAIDHTNEILWLVKFLRG
jgi:hypothetical protein